MIEVLKNDPYLNTIEIGNEYIAFGFNGIQAKLKRKIFLVNEGNSETSILRTTLGISFLVPYSAVSFEKLNELIKSEIL
jgi:hypothetical protein